MKYPTVITKEYLDKNSHVSIKTIKIDIVDTEAEIINLEKEVKAYRLLFETQPSPQNRLTALMLDHKQDGLIKRRQLVSFLQILLLAKQQEKTSDKTRTN